MRYQPRILLATTRRWFSASRLALALAKAGFEVEAICPSGHPLRLTSVLHTVYPFSVGRPIRSFRMAMAKSNPDLIVPCDDLAAIYLHSLQKTGVASALAGQKSYSDLIERSLGRPSSYPILESRADFIAILAAKGVLAPKTASIGNSEELRAWCELNGFPAVLKADGTWSGDGVRVVRDMGEALHAFRSLRAPSTAVRVLKQIVADRDASLIAPWLRRTQRSVSVQSFVAGNESNIAVACLEGRILASISAAVLHTWSKHGPSSIIRLLPDGEMLRVAEMIADTFCLSGFFGLDFILDPETGQTLLIEINPRATQTCHLPLGPQHDLAAALYTALTSRETTPMCAITRTDIALFPLAWQEYPLHPLFKSAYHDIPWEEPSLVKAGELEISIASRKRRTKLWVETHFSRRSLQ